MYILHSLSVELHFEKTRNSKHMLVFHSSFQKVSLPVFDFSHCSFFTQKTPDLLGASTPMFDDSAGLLVCLGIAYSIAWRHHLWPSPRCDRSIAPAKSISGRYHHASSVGVKPVG